MSVRLVMDNKMEAIDLNKFKEKQQVVEPKDGDGDDGGFIPFHSLVVLRASNGYILNTTFEDESEVQEVFDVEGIDDGNEQLLNAILVSMGLDKDYEIKVKKKDT